MATRRIRGLAAAAALLLAAPAAAQVDVPGARVPYFTDPSARTTPVAVPSAPIRFVTTADYPPFNFVDPSGRLTGFNVDLARALCEELAVSCTVQARPFADLGRSVAANEADAVAAGLGADAARAAGLMLTHAYLKLPGRFVVRTGTALDATPEGLDRVRVGAVLGTAHAAYLDDLFAEATRIPFATLHYALAALMAGEVDAVFADGLTLSFWLESDAAAGCCAFLGGPFLDDRYFGAGLAIAVGARDTGLRDALDAALARLAESGRFADLFYGYFPLSFF